MPSEHYMHEDDKYMIEVILNMYSHHMRHLIAIISSTTFQIREKEKNNDPYFFSET